jgi:ribonuclease Z
MSLLFNPCLINNPSGDPGLFVSFCFNKRAIAFDLGDIHSLSPRDLLKISHIFITHTHMDHFVGFDHLLRILLGREKTLYLYGPEGFLDNLEGKLIGYSWNLVNNYRNNLIFYATEVTDKLFIRRQYRSENKFKSSNQIQTPQSGELILHDEPLLSVSAAILDHGIATLGFSLEEKFRINIRKDILIRLGLSPGPWLYRLKEALYKHQDGNEIVEAPGKKIFTLRELADQLTIITKGQKIVYISDVAYTHSNVKKIVKLAQDADHMFIESAFLERDKDHAEKKYHLTAKRAGRIAGLANVKRFELFHFSPRYTKQEELFYHEAMTEYTGCFKQ